MKNHHLSKNFLTTICYLIFSYQYLKCRLHNASFASKMIRLKKTYDNKTIRLFAL